MTEVQAVAYTMEILLACNRTQSGGDTYYCVEYLFRNPGLVVLCPYSSHAEPLQLFLELAHDEPSADTTLLLLDPPATPLFLSDDEGSLQAAHTGNIHPASGSVGGGSTGSGRRDSSLKERRRQTQSVRLPSATARLNNSSNNRDHHHHHHAASNVPPLTRSNSLTKLTSLSPDQPPSVMGAADTSFAKSFPPGGASLRPSAVTAGSYEPTSPPLITSPAGSDTGVAPLPHLPHDEGSDNGGGMGGGGMASTRPSNRPVIRVKIQANTSYKICPSDPQDDNEDIWRCVTVA